MYNCIHTSCLKFRVLVLLLTSILTRCEAHPYINASYCGNKVVFYCLGRSVAVLKHGRRTRRRQPDGGLHALARLKKDLGFFRSNHNGQSCSLWQYCLGLLLHTMKSLDQEGRWVTMALTMGMYMALLSWWRTSHMESLTCSPIVFCNVLCWNNYKFTGDCKEIHRSPEQPSLSFPKCWHLTTIVQYQRQENDIGKIHRTYSNSTSYIHALMCVWVCVCVDLWNFITCEDLYHHYHDQDTQLYYHHKTLSCYPFTATPIPSPHPWQPQVCSPSL